MFRLRTGHPVNPRALAKRKAFAFEPLESRTLLSESASAQLNLVSTTGTQANPVFHYDITVTDTGTTNIGTFWFSWVREVFFPPPVPTAVSSPAGWSASLTGSGNA